MGEKRVSKFSMMKMLLLFGLIPMICTGLAVLVTAILDTAGTVRESVHSELAIVNELTCMRRSSLQISWQRAL